jgi:hypothetical protein
MPDQEMIERVAKAIALRDTTDDVRYKNYILAAITAIKAMREPTAKMKQAVSYMDLHVWENCIDSILND